MDAAELRDKTPDQLREQLEALKKESFNLRFQAATGQLENTAQVKAVRRDAARVKTILNEFVAFQQLAGMLEGDSALAPRSVLLASYALAGFANFGSIAMQIAGIGELAPSKRGTLAQLGMRALFGGAVAALMTAAVAGLMIG